MPLEEAAFSALISQVSRRLLEKLERGKKLTAEDILLLYLDMTYQEIREMRREFREEVARLEKRIDETRDEIVRRISDVDRRVDKLYELLAAQRRGSETSRS